MRFIYFFLMTLATINLIIVLLSGLLGVNIYKVYGKELLTNFCRFMLVVVALVIAIAISGLGS